MRSFLFLMVLSLSQVANNNSEICIVTTSHPDGDNIENVKFYNGYQSALDEAIERAYDSYNYHCEHDNELMCANALTTLNDIHNYYWYLSDHDFDEEEWHDINCGYIEER